MNDVVDIALIGAGAIGNSYAQAIQESPSLRLVAIADTRLDAAAALAEQTDGRAFGSYEELADQVSCQAVLVCTPPASHYAICLHFLERDVPVLCEKPISDDRERAHHLVEVAKRRGVVFTMASKFRYVEDVIRARSALASGILGDVISLENTFTSRVDMSQRWNSDPSVAGGGVLIDNGTHSVDVIRYLLGPIAEVMVIRGKNVQDLEVEDNARMFVRTAEGVICSADVSWSYQKTVTSYIDIYGTYGTLSVGWKESSYQQISSPDAVVFGHGYRKIAALRRQVENFCRAARGLEPLLITCEDAIASVDVIHAAYKSLRSERWVMVLDGTRATDGAPGRDGTPHAQVATKPAEEPIDVVV